MSAINQGKPNKIAPIKIVIICFIVVAIGFAIHLKLKKSERVANLKLSSSSFALSDTTGIDKIIIFNGLDLVTLTKNQNKWFYNGAELANAPAISQLFKAMLTLKPNVTVKEVLMDKEAVNLRSNGIKVQFYAGDIEDRAFYVNKSTLNLKTLMMMVSTGAPYYVTCEGYGDKVNQLFSVNAEDWKSAFLFTSNLKSIQTVECVSSQIPAFKIQYDAGFFKLNNQNEPINQNDLNVYFNELFTLNISHYLPEIEVNSIHKLIATLSVIDVDSKRNNSIEIYEIGEKEVLIKNVKNNRFGFFSKSKFDKIFNNKIVK